MPGENAILQNCLKENVVGCNIRKVLQEECFDDIDSGVIGSGSDFKMDANSGLEFGILIDLGSDLKF
uniref:Uncharacterized protein n=1 Tax=Fagus sylvatica TaxID=28930 RepID=A0A2N9J1F7_FAGSY